MRGIGGCVRQDELVEIYNKEKSVTLEMGVGGRGCVEEMTLSTD